VRKTWVTGLVLTVLAGMLVRYDSALGLEQGRFVLLGATLGAALGAVPDATPGRRAVAWAAGFSAAWFGYLFHAAKLPDTAGGRAVGTVIVLLVITAACAVTRGWLPLWAQLLGVAAMAGSYEVSAGDAPAALVSNSVAATTTVALATALGFLATASLAPLLLGAATRSDADSANRTGDSGDDSAVGSAVGEALGAVPAPRDGDVGVAWLAAAAGLAASPTDARTSPAPGTPTTSED
jgi:hypothetical protein